MDTPLECRGTGSVLWGVFRATHHCMKEVGITCTTERQYSAIKSDRISIPNQPPSEYMTLSKFLQHYLSQPLGPVHRTVIFLFVAGLMKGISMLIKAVLLSLFFVLQKKKFKNDIPAAKWSEDGTHQLTEWCHKAASRPGLAGREHLCCSECNSVSSADAP